MPRFTNQAQLRYGNSVTNSNIAVGEILEVLSMTKTAVRDQYDPNGPITYVISILNSGTLPINGLTLTDNLGAYASGTATLTPLNYLADSVKYYVNGVLQPSAVVTAGPPLVVSGITVPAGGSVTVAYEAAVNEFAPLDTTSVINNTAIVAGTGITPITAEEEITVESTPVLTITKSVSPVPVTENGTLTYTFLIQNSGNVAADASTGVVVTDVFDPVLSNISVTFNQTAWSSPANYSYNETTGAFATNSGQITVPAATFTRDEVTGVWNISPGISTLVVTGTI